MKQKWPRQSGTALALAAGAGALLFSIAGYWEAVYVAGETRRLAVWVLMSPRAIFWPIAGALFGLGMCACHIRDKTNPPGPPEKFDRTLIRRHWRWMVFAAAAGAVAYDLASFIWLSELPWNALSGTGWVLVLLLAGLFTFTGAVQGFVIAYHLLRRRYRS